MESKNLVICDSEEGYAQALAFYLMHRKGLSFQVQVCSSIAHAVLLETEIDFLFISEEYPVDEREKVKAKRVFLLAAGNCNAQSEREISVYKYQSGEKILEELLLQCEDVYKGESIFRKPGRKKCSEVIGIFSPVHRIGKTTYALKLGEELAVSSNVLYLNMEIYGGVGGHFEEGGETLADVLYYSEQEKGNLGLMLTTTVRHRSGLDYVLPMPVSEDIKGVSAETWIELVKKILEQSIYETVILDIDEGIPGVHILLRACTQIYMLTDKSGYSSAKIRQFEREMTLLGYEDVLQKIIRKEGNI